MALTRRGKSFVAGGALAALLTAGAGAVALSGDDGPLAPIQSIFRGGPDPCPLTGEHLSGDREPPARPVLAVKVENTDDAQPLAGLDAADIVYEEVVEGGITRFVVVFHCRDADVVGPVRSARTTDPKILSQFSKHPLLAYSGAAPQVTRVVEGSGTESLTESSTPDAFTRDEGREAPHNLFVSTNKLFTAGRKLAKDEPVPNAVFGFDEEVSRPNKPVGSVTIVFSTLATAEWRWQKGRWIRYVDGEPMLLASGGPLTTDNVVIQQVQVTQSDIVDVAGYPSPEVKLTGNGKAWVLRNGKLILGRWERTSEDDPTVFTTKQGDEILLDPGRTFVELAPRGMFDSTVSFKR